MRARATETVIANGYRHELIEGLSRKGSYPQPSYMGRVNMGLRKCTKLTYYARKKMRLNEQSNQRRTEE
jgi:hypothetical protein